MNKFEDTGYLTEEQRKLSANEDLLASDAFILITGCSVPGKGLCMKFHTSVDTDRIGFLSTQLFRAQAAGIIVNQMVEVDHAFVKKVVEQDQKRQGGADDTL